MSNVVALIGRPNVGKSSLFNALTGSNTALVANHFGLTRDRQYGNVIGTSLVLIDTGGISKESSDLSRAIRVQTNLAIEEADILFFMVDVKEGLLPLDKEISQFLRKSNKPIYLLVNKVDGNKQESLVSDFEKLGFKETFAISTAHNKGISDLIDILLNIDTTKKTERDTKKDQIKVSIIGRPNVGKSTLINKLVGGNRSIVSEEAGTTRDSIQVPIKFNNKDLTLIDTAGVRRKRSIKESIERSSVSRSLEAIRRSDVVILLLDSTESIVDQDLHLLGLSLALRRPVIIGANKTDLLTKKDIGDLKQDISRNIRFASYLKIQLLSAKNGKGVKPLLSKAEKAYISSRKDIDTSFLNNILKKALSEHSPPIKGRFRPKLRYVNLLKKDPFTILIHGNNTKNLSVSYKRYLENYFRTEIGFESSSLQIKFREGENPFENKKNILSERQKKKRKRLIKKRRKK